MNEEEVEETMMKAGKKQHCPGGCYSQQHRGGTSETGERPLQRIPSTKQVPASTCCRPIVSAFQHFLQDFFQFQKKKNDPVPYFTALRLRPAFNQKKKFN